MTVDLCEPSRSLRNQTIMTSRLLQEFGVCQPGLLKIKCNIVESDKIILTARVSKQITVKMNRRQNVSVCKV